MPNINEIVHITMDWDKDALIELERAWTQNYTNDFIPNLYIPKWKEFSEPIEDNELISLYNYRLYLVEGYYKSYTHSWLENLLRRALKKIPDIEMSAKQIPSSLEFETLSPIVDNNKDEFYEYIFTTPLGYYSAMKPIIQIMHVAGFYLEAKFVEDEFTEVYVFEPRYQTIVDYSCVDYFIHISSIYSEDISKHGIRPTQDKIFNANQLDLKNNFYMHPGRVYLFPILKPSAKRRLSNYPVYMHVMKDKIKSFAHKKFAGQNYIEYKIKIPNKKINLYCDPIMDGAVWTYDNIRPEWIIND